MTALIVRFALIPSFLSILSVFLPQSLVLAAELKPAWQVDWDKTVKAAEQERELVIYMTQAFEPVFRETFQKKYPKIKVTTVTGRGPELSQRVMSERRAGKYIADLYISGNITPLTVFYRAKILEPIKPLLVLPRLWIHPAGTKANTITTTRRIVTSLSSRERLEAGRLPTIPNWSAHRRSSPIGIC
jgi:hypothetical protein